MRSSQNIFFSGLQQYKIPLLPYKSFFFSKDLTATVDSVLSKQTWAILRIIEPADSEVPDLTQWWGHCLRILVICVTSG